MVRKIKCHKLSHNAAILYRHEYFFSSDDVNEREYVIQFLRQYRRTNTFIFPNVEDISLVSSNDIVHILKFYSVNRRQGVVIDDDEIRKFFSL